MSLIYEHWKTVVTVRVSASKMHEFSHFGIKRLAKRSEPGGRGELYLVTMWRKP